MSIYLVRLEDGDAHVDEVMAGVVPGMYCEKCNDPVGEDEVYVVFCLSEHYAAGVLDAKCYAKLQAAGVPNAPATILLVTCNLAEALEVRDAANAA